MSQDLIGSEPGKKTYKVALPNGLVIDAELPESNWKGLMGRESLCSGCGMIFVFDHESYHGFWMLNTLIPLAIIWINKELEIVHIERNAEPCVSPKNPYTECKVYTPQRPAKYVLEVNPWVARGIEVGMKVAISPSLE